MPIRMARVAAMGFLLASIGLVLGACNKDGPPRPLPTGPAADPPPPGPSGPITSGSIAFTSNRDGTAQIYLANADGSEVRPLTPGAAPAWARDGGRLAFEANGGNINIISVDGSGRRQIAQGTAPAWSPDGRWIAFEGSSYNTIDVVNTDGSNPRQLYDSRGYGAFQPAWSPDGGRIAFSLGTYVDFGLGLWSMAADGTDARHIGPIDGWVPAWSPDGSQIAFITFSGIAVMNADGSGQRLHVAGQIEDVDWTSDGRLIFTKAMSSVRMGPSRIFVTDAGGERQLIPDAVAPANRAYGDRQAVWLR